jgi:hypothetical protein
MAPKFSGQIVGRTFCPPRQKPTAAKMAALQCHLDRSSGKPFVYRETDDGFELQSSYQVNDKPMKMQFK